MMCAEAVKTELFNGNIPDPKDLMEVMLRCEILQDIVELTPQMINDFYNPKTEDNNVEENKGESASTTEVQA